MSGGLELRDLSVRRDGTRVVNAVTLQAPPNAITVLLGANGVGKSTLLDAVGGVLRHDVGSIVLDGKEIGALSSLARARRGLAYVEQGRTIFATLTTEENLFAAAGTRDVDVVYGIFEELKRRAKIPAAMLSGGEQQMLVIARALLQKPKLLMIDELSLGLSPVVTLRLLDVIRGMAGPRLGILLVEQYVDLALRYGDFAYVLGFGGLTFSGSCADLRGRPDLIAAAYLGAHQDAAPEARSALRRTVRG